MRSIHSWWVELPTILAQGKTSPCNDLDPYFTPASISHHQWDYWQYSD